MARRKFFHSEALSCAHGNLRTILTNATLFDISNISVVDKDGYGWTELDDVDLLPITPPFKNMWLEWRLNHTPKIDQSVTYHIPHAVLLNTEEVSNGWIVNAYLFTKKTRENALLSNRLWQEHDVNLSTSIVDEIELLQKYAVINLDESGHQKSEILLFDIDHKAFAGGKLVYFDATSADIRGWTAEKLKAQTRDRPKSLGQKIESDERLKLMAIRDLRHKFSMVKFALALLNTKNVEMLDSDSPIKKVNHRRRKQKKRTQGERHYTLRIRPGSQRNARSGDAQPSGIKNSFHIARGHFKTYTEDAPLLGKYVGTWWWQAQVRGSRSTGTVTKDYEVHPPTKDDE